MPFTYVHLSGRDLDEAILKIHGKIPKDNNRIEFNLKKMIEEKVRQIFLK